MGKFAEFYVQHKKDCAQKRVVVNVPNTAGDTCSDGSWKEYWESRSGQSWPTQCAVERCEEKAEHGAHVRYASDDDGCVYIVPLCATHNNAENTSSMEIRSDVQLVKVEKE